jgi:hypothetical protein
LRFLDGLSTFFVGVWSAVKTLAAGVEKFATMATKVMDLAKILASGSVDQSYPLPVAGWKWNVAPAVTTKNYVKDKLTLTAGITCDDCYASLDFSLTFRLKVVNYELVLVSAIAKGAAEVSAAITLFAKASYAAGKDFEIGKVTASPITFVIGGVPIVIDIEVPIVAEWGVDMNANVNVGFGFKMTGEVTYGFEHRPRETPATKMIGERNFPAITKSMKELSGTAKFAMSVGIMPVMNIRVQGIGGPSAGLKAKLVFSLDADSKRACKLKATLNLDVELSMGAFLKIGIPGTRINFPETKVPSKAIYHFQKALINGCVVGSGRRRGLPSITPTTNIDLSQVTVGMVWEGTQTPGENWGKKDCTMFPAFRQMSLQVVSVPHDGLRLVLSSTPCFW